MSDDVISPLGQSENDGAQSEVGSYRYRCSICDIGGIFDSIVNRDLFRKVHDEQNPECLEVERLYKYYFDTPNRIKSRLYICEICGYNARGKWARDLHADTHRNKQAEKESKETEQKTKESLNQKIMVLACLHSGARTWSEIQTKFQMLFEKPIPDNSLKRVLDKLIAENKIAKAKEGYCFV